MFVVRFPIHFLLLFPVVVSDFLADIFAQRCMLLELCREWIIVTAFPRI